MLFEILAQRKLPLTNLKPEIGFERTVVCNLCYIEEYLLFCFIVNKILVALFADANFQFNVSLLSGHTNHTTIELTDIEAVSLIICCVHEMQDNEKNP